MKRIVATALLALPLLAACGGPDPDLGYVRAVLTGTDNPAKTMDDAQLTRLGELVCSDPDNPGPSGFLVAEAGRQAGLTDLQANQVVLLLQSEFCPA